MRAANLSLALMVFRYLSYPMKDIVTIQYFRTMKVVFIRYNTNLCWSMAVERLLWFASESSRHSANAAQKKETFLEGAVAEVKLMHLHC